MFTVAVPQLSVAVNTAGAGMLSQEAVVLTGAAWSNVGARVSLTLIVWNTEEVLPHASVNVQVLVTVNEFGQLP